MTNPELVTIGVYGCSETAFFDALRAAGVDTFCDIRQRRGVRGSDYAFVNSKRLQARLAELGIRYLHYKPLAPTAAMRAQQKQADSAQSVAKRVRRGLSTVFVEAYRDTILQPLDAVALRAALPADAAVVALFCVEREPDSCHRSLSAAHLARAWGVKVTHLQP